MTTFRDELEEGDDQPYIYAIVTANAARGLTPPCGRHKWALVSATVSSEPVYTPRVTTIWARKRDENGE